MVETFKTNAFNASFNAFVLDRVIGPFGTCNGSLLVFLGWSTSKSVAGNSIEGAKDDFNYGNEFRTHRNDLYEARPRRGRIHQSITCEK